MYTSAAFSGLSSAGGSLATGGADSTAGISALPPPEPGSASPTASAGGIYEAHSTRHVRQSTSSAAILLFRFLTILHLYSSMLWSERPVHGALTGQAFPVQ